FRCGGHRRVGQLAGGARRRADRELRSHRRNPVFSRDRARSALSDRRAGAAGQADGLVRDRLMKADVAQISYRPKVILAIAAAVVLVALALLPSYVGLYQVQLLTYGLTASIAALGFNI